MLSFMKYLLDQGNSTLDEQAARVYQEQLARHESDDLAIAAIGRVDRSHFVRMLAAKGVWVILQLDQAQFEADLHLLQYADGNRVVLPVFSSLAEAMTFVRMVGVSEVLAVQYLHVSAALLTHDDLAECRIVLNPSASASTEILREDMDGLRALYRDL